VALEEIRERFLPEYALRSRDKRKLQFAVLVVAALTGGAEPDLLDEIAAWQTDDCSQYATFPAVAYIRIAADRAGVPVHQVYQDLTPPDGPTARLTPAHAHPAGLPERHNRATSRPHFERADRLHLCPEQAAYAKPTEH
jgi:hypothetical protein